MEVFLDRPDLAVGESVSLHIAVNVHGRSGWQSYSTTLVDLDEMHWQCSIKVFVCEVGSLSPESDLAFGSLAPGSQVERDAQFDMYAATEAELPRLLDVKSTNPSVTVAATDAGVVDWVATDTVRRRVSLKVRLDPGLMAGPHSAELIVRFGNPAQTNEKRLAVNWGVPTLVSCSPAMVYFGRIENGGESIRTVTLQRSDRQSLTVSNATIVSPFRAEVLPSSSPSEQRVLVRLRATDVAKTIATELRLTTNHPLQPEVVIPVVVVGPTDEK
jgi:hypothetical protein